MGAIFLFLSTLHTLLKIHLFVVILIDASQLWALLLHWLAQVGLSRFNMPRIIFLSPDNCTLSFLWKTTPCIHYSP